VKLSVSLSLKEQVKSLREQIETLRERVAEKRKRFQEERAKQIARFWLNYALVPYLEGVAERFNEPLEDGVRRLIREGKNPFRPKKGWNRRREAQADIQKFFAYPETSEEFYEKWKRDPNWCEKCDTSVWYINRYIDLTQEYPWLKELSEGALRPVFTKKLAGYRYKVAEEIRKLLEERDLDRDPETGKLRRPITRKEIFTIVKKVLGEVIEEEEQPKVEARVYKPKETWEYRKARMGPSISKMDEAVLLALAKRGIHPEFQKKVCIKHVVPDLWFELPDRPLAVFLDGPVHVGREDRDEALSDLLRKRGVEVLRISYKEPSKSEIQDVIEKVMSALAERGLKW